MCALENWKKADRQSELTHMRCVITSSKSQWTGKRSKSEVSQGHDSRMDTNRKGNIERRAISRHATWDKRDE